LEGKILKPHFRDTSKRNSSKEKKNTEKIVINVFENMSENKKDVT